MSWPWVPIVVVRAPKFENPCPMSKATSKTFIHFIADAGVKEIFFPGPWPSSSIGPPDTRNVRNPDQGSLPDGRPHVYPGHARLKPFPGTVVPQQQPTWSQCYKSKIFKNKIDFKKVKAILKRNEPFPGQFLDRCSTKHFPIFILHKLLDRLLNGSLFIAKNCLQSVSGI